MKLTLLLLVLFQCMIAALHAADLILTDVGVAPSPIIVFKVAPPRTWDAAMTLANYIEKISGKKPAVLDGKPRAVPDRAIWIGVQPVGRRTGDTAHSRDEPGRTANRGHSTFGANRGHSTFDKAP